MTALRLVVSALIVTISASTLSLAVEPSPSSDLGRLQGRWVGTAGAKGKLRVEIEFKGSDAHVAIATPQGAKFRVKGEVRLDESTTPRSLDWVNFNGLDNQEMPEIPAIYLIEGDTFKICNGGPNNSRPTEFKRGDGILADVITFSRVR